MKWAAVIGVAVLLAGACAEPTITPTPTKTFDEFVASNYAAVTQVVKHHDGIAQSAREYVLSLSQFRGLRTDWADQKYGKTIASASLGLGNFDPLWLIERLEWIRIGEETQWHWKEDTRQQLLLGAEMLETMVGQIAADKNDLKAANSKSKVLAPFIEAASEAIEAEEAVLNGLLTMYNSEKLVIVNAALLGTLEHLSLLPEFVDRLSDAPYHLLEAQAKWESARVLLYALMSQEYNQTKSLRD